MLGIKQVKQLAIRGEHNLSVTAICTECMSRRADTTERKVAEEEESV
jgi:hypothetical protein